MKVLLLTLLASGTALAKWSHHEPVLPRQVEEIPCSEFGQEECGDGCIPLLYTCCPGGTGGCQLGTVCGIADDGEPGCCPIGADCSGPGGVITESLGGIDTTSTITIDVPGTVSEVPNVPTDEPAPEPTSSAEDVPSPPLASSSSSPSVAPVPTNGTSTGPPAPIPTAGAAVNALPVYILPGVLAGVAMMAF